MFRVIQLTLTAVIVFLSAPVVFAQNTSQLRTTTSLPVLVPQTPWFANPTIRQDLRWEPNQVDRLNQVYADQYRRFQRAVVDLGENPSAAEREARLGALRQEFYRSITTSTHELLTDPAQRERFNQLYWQYRGWDALNDARIQGQLNLTAAQRLRLADRDREWNRSIAELRRNYRIDQDASIQKFETIRRQMAEEMNTFYTPDQRRAWQRLVGEPYTFPPVAYFDRPSKPE